MKEPAYSPVTDLTRAAVHAYAAVGSIAGTLTYFGGAFVLLARGDLCSLIVWILFLGPIVAPLVGVLWPLAFLISASSL